MHYGGAGLSKNGSLQMKHAATLVTIALVAISTTAFGAEITGTIKTVDKSHDSIRLADGRKFTLPEGIEAETLKVGEKVKIVYSSKAGKTMVTSIQAAQ